MLFIIEDKKSMVYPFSEEAYIISIAELKNNKDATIADVMVEQQNKCGPKTHKCLLIMLNNCFIQNKIPTIWGNRTYVDHRHNETRERLRYVKATGHYPFCATPTNSANA